MNFSRTSTGSFKAKLSSFRKKFQNFFHRHQVPKTVSNQQHGIFELTFTSEVTPLPKSSDNQAGRGLGTSTSLPVSIGTAASTLPTPLSHSATIETPVTTIAVNTNDKESILVTPSSPPPPPPQVALLEKALLVINENFEPHAPKPSKAKSMAVETEGDNNNCSFKTSEWKDLFELYQEAVKVFCPLIEPQAASLPTVETKDRCQEVEEEVPLFDPSISSLLLSEHLIVHSAALERIISGDLHRSDACISPGLSDYSNGSEAYYRGKIPRDFLRLYQHPKQIRKRTRAVGNTK